MNRFLFAIIILRLTTYVKSKDVIDKKSGDKNRRLYDDVKNAISQL